MSLRDIKHPSILLCDASDPNESKLVQPTTSYTSVIALNHANCSDLAISIEVDSLAGFAEAGETLDAQLQESISKDGPFIDVTGKTMTQVIGTASFPVLRTIKIQGSNSVTPLLPYVRVKLTSAAQPAAKAITDFTFAADEVTITVADPVNSNIQIGDSIVIASATSAGNNGTFVVTAKDTVAETITFSNPDGVTEAGGSATLAFASSEYGWYVRAIAHTSGA